MPLAIRVPNFCTTSTGPGKNTGGKRPERATAAQSTTTGTNGTQRRERRVARRSSARHGAPGALPRRWTPIATGAAHAALRTMPQRSIVARSSGASSRRSISSQSTPMTIMPSTITSVR